MKYPRDKFDSRFREYRDALQREVGRFRDAASVFRQINQRKNDFLRELNIAPAFFNIVEDALFTTIILWIDKLTDEKGQRGLFNFLAFIENNRDWMTVKELQRRRNYPDDHWMLRPEHRGPPITAKSIEVDKEKLRRLTALKSINLRRDKFQAHFDADYFFDRTKLQTEAPITWENLEEAGATISVMLNEYSADFDGNTHEAESINIGDLSALLRAARKGSG